MKAMTNIQAPVGRLEEGDWLLQLLSDIRREVAREPSPSTVERIRARLLASIQRPTRAAA